MSGNLRLNGATSGYSQLAAPDVAGDQTFTFPTTGGTLAIASNNAVGVPVAGYQSGVWRPTINSESGTALWMTDGVTVSGRVLDGSCFSWWRIGQTVTAHTYLKLNADAPSDNSAFLMRNLPYVARPSTQDVEDFAYTAAVYPSRLARTDTSRHALFALVMNRQDLLASGARYDGETIYFGKTTLTVNQPAETLRCDEIFTDASFVFAISYQTADTTWTPTNGATLTP